MNAFMLIGSYERMMQYLNQFYKKYNIKNYYIQNFPDFKILDARNLIKLLSKKLPQKESRAILISNPTIEAQNAILKTIEELPPGVFLFFLTNNKESLLPTIRSRCLIMDLGENRDEEIRDKNLKQDLEDILFKNDASKAFSLYDKYKKDEILDNILYELRSILIENLNDLKKSQIAYTAICKFLKLIPLAKNNNVQEKLIVENVFVPIFPS